jgi:hypothetical protein
MPSTYTLNNGIELIATGEKSGTWGDTTNVNFSLIDTALDGQVTITLGAAGSSGSPNSLEITDGSSSNGRNRMLIFTDGGDLGASAFVQLTPNDAEKIFYVRNNLSGNRALVLFQGTYNAANDYEVPAGTTAVVFFNGGGAGAVAANVFNNAHFDSLNIVGNVSVGGTVDGRDIASDGTKLDTIETNADVTDTANVTAAGALMDSELTNIAAVKALNQGVATTDSPSFAGLTATTADINGGTIDGAVIGGTTPAAISGTTGTFSGLTATTADINGGTIDGAVIGGTTPAAGTFSGLTATTADINGGTIDGAVIGGTTPAAISGTTGTFSGAVSAADLNLNGAAVTATAAELNILDGVTATAAEINKLDGFTGVAADLNYAKDLRATGVTTAEFDKLDGLTATTTELNYTDGVTSNIQTQLNSKMATASYPDLVAIESLSSTGIAVRTTTNTWAQRSIGVSGLATISNGNGVAGNPTVNVPAATQAEAEAGTDNTKAMTPLRVEQAIVDRFNITGSAPTYAARAWVNFNGTGTVAIRESGNVSSITDNGAGDYTVNFTTATPDANYALVGSCGQSPADRRIYSVGVRLSVAQTTTSCRVLCVYRIFNDSGGAVDNEQIQLAFLR